ncbi:MAG: hypothetical protein LBD47_03290 [Treponema sp.]|nr:hypothetical protein [Treponema sp.]
MKRAAGSGIKSWELTDDLWERVKDCIPLRKRNENKTCRRKPGAGWGKVHIITLIKKFLKSGVMADGLVSQSEQGTP